MKKLVLILAIAAFFVVVPRAHAQLDEQDWTDPCAGTMDPDVCMGVIGESSGTMVIVKCTEAWGCPMCGFDNEMKNSICYRQWTQWGYCQCEPKAPYVDKFGIRRPNCKVQGSCTAR